MDKKIALLKINNQTYFPTEIFQKIPTADLDLKNKYDSFVFGLEAFNNFDLSIKRNLHYYKFYKKDLTKPSTQVRLKLSGWSTNIINRGFKLLSTDVFNDKMINPVTLTHLSIKSLIETTLNKLSNVRKNTKVKIVFSQPPFDKEKDKKNYHDNFLTAIRLTKETLRFNNKNNIILDFPDEVSKQYFIYEQYAAFDFFAAQSGIIEDKKEGNYLIIDAGALTTDLAIIRRSKSSGEINYRNKPTFLSIDVAGQFIDKKILELVKSKYNLNLDNNSELHLLKNIEEVRVEISFETNYILVPFEEEMFEINNYEIEKIYNEYFERIREAILKIKNLATKTFNLKEEIVIDKIFITGGLSNDVYFKKWINKVLEETNIFYTNIISPSSVVSVGMATEYLKGKEKIVPISKFEGRFESDQKEELFFKRKYEDLELNVLFHSEELTKKEIDIDEYAYHKLDKTAEEITVSIKSDIDIDFDNNNKLKVPLKDKINSGIKISYSNKVETKNNNDIISFNYKPYFYTENFGERRRKISEDVNKKFEFKDKRKIKTTDYDILLAIDFGMANSSVAVVANEKYLNSDNFYFIDFSEKNNQSKNVEENSRNSIVLNNKLLELINKNNALLLQLSSKISTLESKIGENNMNGENKSKTISEFYEEIISEPIEEKIDIEEYKKELLHKNNEPNTNKIFEKFSEYLKLNNKFYDEKTIYSFIQAIYSNSNYLIILAGPPGVGKSSLISSFYKFLTSNYILSDIDLFSLIPVAPNWFTVENLIGNYNEFSGKLEIKPFSKLIAYALNIERKFKLASPPIIAVLDEFNIAQPELYLSSILSKMEADGKDRKISIRDKAEESYELEIPKNFRIVGTINIDAASKNLSPKILDRAHFIRVNPDYESIETFFKNITEKNSNKLINKLKVQLIEEKSIKDKSLLEFCFETALYGGSFISFRTVEKIANYILDVTPESKLSLNEHIDVILSQFILPKLPANNHFNNVNYSNALELLNKKLNKNEAYKNSRKIIERMIISKMPGQFV